MKISQLLKVTIEIAIFVQIGKTSYANWWEDSFDDQEKERHIQTGLFWTLGSF